MNGKKRKVICLETKQIWDSINQCAFDLNVCASSLRNAIKKNKKLMGYYFKMYEEE